jgi:hypothetical protein
MKRLQILAIPLLVGLALLMGVGMGACGGGEEAPPTTEAEGEAVLPEPEAEAVTPEQEEVVMPEKEEEPPTPAPPTPGEWVASAEFGELVLTVTPDSTGISKIALNFSGEFSCEGRSFSGTISNESTSPWPITDGQFTVDIDMLMLGQITIEGSFDETGNHASGTWELDTCSGTWESP